MSEIKHTPAPDAMRERVRDAVAEALGDAYDCTRVWSAWGVGTMGPDDFSPVAEDDDRLTEIVDAALDAAAAPELLEALESIRRYGLDTLSGRADGGIDDREWQREAVNEMTKRARIAIEKVTGSQS
jgi:hypothetical protein